MSRIFASLSVFALIFLILDLTIGLCGPDFNGLSAEYRQNAAAIAGKLEGVEPLAAADADALRARLMAAKGYVRWHILFGILAAVATVLVQSVGVTYFIGTGRWCKEVVETYELDEDWVKRSNRTKRASFPWAMLGMSTVLAIAAFGAAADPGTLSESTQDWVKPHYWLAIGGTAVIAICLWFQSRAISRNQQIVESILDEVRQVRERRGLEVEVG